MFFIFVLFVLGVVCLAMFFSPNTINVSILFLSTAGLALFVSYIISVIIINNEINTASGPRVSIIYYKIKNRLEILRNEETELEKECSTIPLLFPAYFTGKDPRKELAKIKIRICLAETELRLFD